MTGEYIAQKCHDDDDQMMIGEYVDQKCMTMMTFLMINRS